MTCCLFKEWSIGYRSIFILGFGNSLDIGDIRYSNDTALSILAGHLPSNNSKGLLTSTQFLITGI